MAAAVLYNVVAYRSRSLAACILAHATSNQLSGIVDHANPQWGLLVTVAAVYECRLTAGPTGRASLVFMAFHMLLRTQCTPLSSKKSSSVPWRLSPLPA
jgi:hypothetical protein